MHDSNNRIASIGGFLMLLEEEKIDPKDAAIKMRKRLKELSAVLDNYYNSQKK